MSMTGRKFNITAERGGLDGFVFRNTVLSFSVIVIVLLLVSGGALVGLAFLLERYLGTPVTPNSDPGVRAEQASAVVAATIGLAVAFAGAFVAILLARRAVAQADQLALNNHRQLRLEETTLFRDLILTSGTIDQHLEETRYVTSLADKIFNIHARQMEIAAELDRLDTDAREELAQGVGPTLYPEDLLEGCDSHEEENDRIYDWLMTKKGAGPLGEKQTLLSKDLKTCVEGLISFVRLHPAGPNAVREHMPNENFFEQLLKLMAAAAKDWDEDGNFSDARSTWARGFLRRQLSWNPLQRCAPQDASNSNHVAVLDFLDYLRLTMQIRKPDQIGSGVHQESRPSLFDEYFYRRERPKNLFQSEHRTLPFSGAYHGNDYCIVFFVPELIEVALRITDPFDYVDGVLKKVAENNMIEERYKDELATQVRLKIRMMESDLPLLREAIATIKFAPTTNCFHFQKIEDTAPVM